MLRFISKARFSKLSSRWEHGTSERGNTHFENTSLNHLKEDFVCVSLKDSSEPFICKCALHTSRRKRGGYSVQCHTNLFDPIWHLFFKGTPIKWPAEGSLRKKVSVCQGSKRETWPGGIEGQGTCLADSGFAWVGFNSKRRRGRCPAKGTLARGAQQQEHRYPGTDSVLPGRPPSRVPVSLLMSCSQPHNTHHRQ